MKLKFYSKNVFSLVTARLTIVSLIFLLNACDSSTDVPVQKVDNIEQQSYQDDKDTQQKTKNISTSAKEKNTYYFGFDLRSSPQEDAAQYLPFLNYLERSTGYHFKLHFTPKNSSTADELGKNKTQFASMGATSYLDAQSRFNVISLVRGINHRGKAEYQSVLVVRPKSKINRIEDIEGRHFAFGGRDSTQGHLIPRIMMANYNIKLKDLRSYIYTGSHQKCAEAVVSGKAEVCGMQDQLAEKLSGQGLLKIIHRSAYFPSSGIVANKLVSTEVIERVKKALVGFYPQGIHRKGLYNWERTEMPRGFSVANERDYLELREWSVQFGFLK